MAEGEAGRIRRIEIQEAIAKAVELRALHAALMQGNNNHSSISPANLKLLSANPQFSGHDYPVFTPSYEEEPLPISGQIQMSCQITPETCNNNDDDDDDNNNNIRTELVDHNHHICPAVLDDTKSVASSSTNHVSFLQTTSPGPDTGVKSKRRTSVDDTKSVASSCNKCRPATMMISTSSNNNDHISKTSIVPVSDCASHSSSQNKPRGTILSWLIPRSRRKQKNAEGGGPNSPLRAESEEVSQVLKDLGMVSIEALKKELVDANLKRELAVKEASEMRSSFGELKKKLEFLESHCEQLKKALLRLSNREEFKQQDTMMPVSEEAMVEGFLQIVSEARLSMKQFCKTLFRQIDPKDEHLTNHINHLLTPYKLTLNSKHPKVVLYHLSAIINQAFYQDFENCVFQKNGTPKSLNPHQERQQNFQSFVSLRNLSWNEVLNKGTKHYSEEFSRFCDQKMNSIVVTLNWTRQWPENLLQSFFVAAKCVWLLHLLAFSFHPPLMILRVDENRQFDGHYMEDVFKYRQKLGEGPSRVKVMVMPGFYVQDRILRCKVLCRYKSAA